MGTLMPPEYQTTIIKGVIIMLIEKWKLTSIILGFFLLSACSNFPTRQSNVKKPSASVSGKQNLWKKRQIIVAKKAVWNLDSKIALRYRANHWNFGLRWLQQSKKQYVMQIKNPVTGGLLAKLSRNNNSVSLLADDGKTYRDTDEERLLLRQTGVKLPIKGMQHWVRGLSSPLYKVDKLVLDSKGRAQSLVQAGWEINYSRYVNNNSDAMPQKIIITREKDSVYLKMIAKKWKGI